jgi:hypothetical protein
VRSGSGGATLVGRDRGGVARGGELCLWCCNTIGTTGIRVMAGNRNRVGSRKSSLCMS